MKNSEYSSYDRDAQHIEDNELRNRILAEVIEQECNESEEQQESENYANDEQPEPKQNKISEFVMLMLTGNVLTLKEVSKYYVQMFVVALLFFISIVVLFWSLHRDVSHNRLVNEVQMLREKSVRLKEVRSARSSHPAIVEEMQRRGIKLEESKQPAILIK